MAKRDHLQAAETKLRGFGLRFAEVTENFPWDHRALKVKGKIFLVLNRQPAFLTLSVKLPDSARDALRLPFASPTRYGLGKSGWVTAKFDPGDKVPVEMLFEWINESYRAIAPKRVLAQMDGPSPNAVESRKPRKSSDAKSSKSARRAASHTRRATK